MLLREVGTFLSNYYKKKHDCSSIFSSNEKQILSKWRYWNFNVIFKVGKNISSQYTTVQSHTYSSVFSSNKQMLRVYVGYTFQLVSKQI